jgi:hypothetical protein
LFGCSKIENGQRCLAVLKIENGQRCLAVDNFNHNLHTAAVAAREFFTGASFKNKKTKKITSKKINPALLFYACRFSEQKNTLTKKQSTSTLRHVRERNNKQRGNAPQKEKKL